MYMDMLLGSVPCCQPEIGPCRDAAAAVPVVTRDANSVAVGTRKRVVLAKDKDMIPKAPDRGFVRRFPSTRLIRCRPQVGGSRHAQTGFLNRRRPLLRVPTNRPSSSRSESSSSISSAPRADRACVKPGQKWLDREACDTRPV